MSKRIFIDMDDTIADFKAHPDFKGLVVDNVSVSKMFRPGFFLELKPMEGAAVAVRQLIRMGFDVQILTQPVAESPHCYAEKVQWIALHFPELLNKINMVQDKGLMRGHWLIDDNADKWRDKFQASEGQRFWFFDYHKDHAKQWADIAAYFDGVSASERVKD